MFLSFHKQNVHYFIALPLPVRTFSHARTPPNSLIDGIIKYLTAAYISMTW